MTNRSSSIPKYWGAEWRGQAEPLPRMQEFYLRWVVLGWRADGILTRPRRQRSSFRAPTQPRRARPMVRIPETARALDQICRGMKDKPGGGESRHWAPCVQLQAAPFPTPAAYKIGSSILGGLFLHYGTLCSGSLSPPHPESLCLSFWNSLLCLSLLSLSLSFFLQILLTPNSFSPATSVTLDQSL